MQCQDSQPSPAMVEAIFTTASALPLDERPTYLASACGSDTLLRQRVEALLGVQEAPEKFLPRRPGAPPAGVPISTAAPAEQLGDTIGRYKLLQKIGEGGWGVVYMAEQEEPVRRRVALKVIKLGMDTKQVVARFEAERQALALMDHANIAKVLDAGATDAGRPYFVMELVGGIKITDYCDQNQLSTRQRLDLFIQVCHAIQHAHQKGVIHRDIKPSNVLVAQQDGVAVPKVIDFGIAKATQGRLTDGTAITAFEQFLGTPAYMSPEQAQVGGLDVDTRSDIYSLGVLLYELLTGKTPFDAKELLAVGLEAMRRTICEKEPPKPSTRLAQELVAADVRRLKTPTSDAPDFGEEIRASSRRLLQGKEVQALRGDLDWIVMKCLEKDRSRRYETANGLAMDLERHLGNEPVVACPPGRLYRFQKFVRRNKMTTSAVALIALVLILGIIGTTWQAVRATRAETLAKQRLTESEALSKFLRGVFRSPDPTRDGRTITVAEALNKAARDLERDLATQPARRAHLQANLALTYDALGLYREAIALQEQARDYHLAVSGPEHPATLEAMHNLAISYQHAGRRGEAIELLERVSSLRLKVQGTEHTNTLKTMSDLAALNAELGRRPEAIKLLEEVLALSRRINGLENPDTLAAMINLASSYSLAGRRDEALKLREQTLPLSRKVFGPEHPNTLWAMHNLANSYSYAGRRDEALKLREQTLALRRKVDGPEHPDTLSAMINLSASYDDAGRRAEALELRELVLPLSCKVLGPEHPNSLTAMDHLAKSYGQAGRANEAINLREQALVLNRRVNGPEHPDTLWAMNSLGFSYFEAGRRAEALALRDQVLALRRKVLGPEHPDTLWAMIALAGSYRTAGQPEEAVKLGQSSLELYRRKLGPTQENTLNAMTELAISYRVASRTAEAIALEQESLRLKREHLPPGHAMTVESMENLATCYEQSNMKPEAEALRRELAELGSKATTNGPASTPKP
jgi:eukaryotic-like serine/threonine-protein kinase